MVRGKVINKVDYTVYLVNDRHLTLFSLSPKNALSNKVTLADLPNPYIDVYCCSDGTKFSAS